MKCTTEIEFTFGGPGPPLRLAARSEEGAPSIARLFMPQDVSVFGSWTLTAAECEEIAAVFSRMAAVLRGEER